MRSIYLFLYECYTTKNTTLFDRDNIKYLQFDDVAQNVFTIACILHQNKIKINEENAINQCLIYIKNDKDRTLTIDYIKRINNDNETIVYNSLSRLKSEFLTKTITTHVNEIKLCKTHNEVIELNNRMNDMLVSSCDMVDVKSFSNMKNSY